MECANSLTAESLTAKLILYYTDMKVRTNAIKVQNNTIRHCRLIVGALKYRHHTEVSKYIRIEIINFSMRDGINNNKAAAICYSTDRANIGL